MKQYKQYIIRRGTFDAGHRVMHEKKKCFNIHGHTYLFELNFIFYEIEDIGYAIDFKEIKRVGAQWIDDHLDHAVILNPQDDTMANAVEAIGSKVWFMSLNGSNNYCNPTVENIAKEIFLAIEVLFDSYPNLNINQIRLYETPNCYTECFSSSIPPAEKTSFLKKRKSKLLEYRKQKGRVEYDSRKKGGSPPIL